MSRLRAPPRCASPHLQWPNRVADAHGRAGREQKAKEAKERREREMALLFKQAPKSKGEIAREKAAAAAKVARVVRRHLQHGAPLS